MLSNSSSDSGYETVSTRARCESESLTLNYDRHSWSSIDDLRRPEVTIGTAKFTKGANRGDVQSIVGRAPILYDLI